MQEHSYQALARAILDGHTVYRVTALDGAQIGEGWNIIGSGPGAGRQGGHHGVPAAFVCTSRQTGARLLCEALRQQKVLLVCGGGHVSVPVAKLGKLLGYRVLVADDRPEFADPARFPPRPTPCSAGNLRSVCRLDWDALPDLSVVIVTRGTRPTRSACARPCAIRAPTSA